jgi:HEAT repeat protein
MDLRLLRRFLTDPSPLVRRAAIWPLGQFRERHPAEAAEAAVSVELGDDLRLADEVYGLFCRYGQIDPALLTDAQIDDLLAKLSAIP